jgi:hypothetical protein
MKVEAASYARWKLPAAYRPTMIKPQRTMLTRSRSSTSAFPLRNAAIFIQGKQVNVIDDIMKLELLNRLNLVTDIGYQLADQGACITNNLYIIYHACNLLTLLADVLPRNAAIFIKGLLVNVIDDTMRLELLKRLNLETDIRHQIAAYQGLLA